MQALEDAVRLGLLTLRQALMAKGVDEATPLCEALWELAHDKPGPALDVGESLACAALWVERSLVCDIEGDRALEAIGFRGGDGEGGAETEAADVGSTPTTSTTPERT